MKRLELEVRGRMMAIETVQLTMLAHVAALTQNPNLFIAEAMNDIDNDLRRGEQAAQSADDRAAASCATESFRVFSVALLAHVNKIALRPGRA